MRKYLILFLFFGYCLSVKANHIVGGEIEFITISPGVYKINLIQYRDETQTANPDPENSEPVLTISLFANSDDSFVRNFRLLYEGQAIVRYTNIECQIAELRTNKVVWTATFELDPAAFADVEGYYLAWERCCRNEAIQNLVNPVGTGMKYVLEIPPLSKDGRPFLNTSPLLNPPLRDYACVGQFYYTSFVGLDPDGDSLVYRLANPLNSSTGEALPITLSKPHLNVFWEDGYSLEEQIKGNPALAISNRGLLTVTPSEPGLFVFSVIAEEWRYDNEQNESVKIGEVQRDFQMLVLDGCTAPPPPILDIQVPEDPTFDPANDTLIYAAEDEKCFNFFVTNIKQGENVSFRADPVNFDGEYDVLNGVKFTVGENDELTVEFCVPDCPPIDGRPYLVDFIVQDDICPLPQLDSVRVAIQVEPPPNATVLVTPVEGKPFNVLNGNKLSFDFLALDADSDNIDVSLVFNDQLTIDERGMTFEITNQEPGRVEGTFTWDVDCNVYDFTDKNDFRVGIRAEDADQCLFENPFIEWVDLKAILPGNTNPVVSTGSTILNVQADQEISFDVFANDIDGDFLQLRMLGDGFDPLQFGIIFQDTSGFANINSEFNWTLACDNINLLAKNEFRFFFIADDSDECNTKNFDTLSVDVVIALPQNANPEITPIQRFYQLNVNEPFELPIEATDLNIGDSITLQFNDSFRRPISTSLEFETAVGIDQVSSLLKWTPECRLLPLGSDGELYDLYFIAFDNSCPVTGLDTIKLTFEIIETREAFEAFDPPNVFTPNGDEWNNVFTLSGFSDAKRNLPLNNCEDEFDFIVIQDRTGKTVFESTSREFTWTGGDRPAGTYYYFISYTKTQFKGIITLLK